MCYDRPSDARNNIRVHSTCGAALLYLNLSLLHDSMSTTMGTVNHVFVTTNAKSLREMVIIEFYLSNDRVYALPP